MSGEEAPPEPPKETLQQKIDRLVREREAGRLWEKPLPTYRDRPTGPGVPTHALKCVIGPKGCDVHADEMAEIILEVGSLEHLLGPKGHPEEGLAYRLARHGGDDGGDFISALTVVEINKWTHVPPRCTRAATLVDDWKYPNIRDILKKQMEIAASGDELLMRRLDAARASGGSFEWLDPTQKPVGPGADVPSAPIGLTGPDDLASE